MGTVIWRGGAPAVAHLQTITVSGTWATGDTATITINGHDITFTVAATETIAAVVAGLVAAWNASTIPEVAEVTAADASPDITLTADTAGKPFTVTTSEVTAGDGELGDPVETTANEGPYCWDTPENWDTGAMPVAADDMVFENSSISCIYNLSQAGATLTSLTIMQSYTGTIGLPYYNASGYREYRPQYLAIDATTVRVGKSGTGSGTGSGRIKIDSGTVQTTVHVTNTGTALDQNVGAFVWKGTHASNVIYLNKGDVSIAPYAGETATIATLNIGYIDRIDSDVSLSTGGGLTLTTVNCDGGVTTLEDDITTLTQRGGELTIRGAATVTTFNAYGGVCYCESTGTITTLNGKAGAINCSRDMQTRTITDMNLYSGFTLTDPHDTITFTNAPAISEGLEVRT